MAGSASATTGMNAKRMRQWRRPVVDGMGRLFSEAVRRSRSARGNLGGTWVMAPGVVAPIESLGCDTACRILRYAELGNSIRTAAGHAMFRYLSKSRILSRLQCPKRLWLEANQPALAEVDARPSGPSPSATVLARSPARCGRTVTWSGTTTSSMRQSRRPDVCSSPTRTAPCSRAPSAMTG